LVLLIGIEIYGANAEVIKNKPVLILWGEKDDFIKKNNLEKWQDFLSNEKTHLLEAGHFVQEEKTDDSIEIIRHWLSTKNN
jgi:pimeloyl-ACP methyl ester carboxylesterase